MTSPGDGGDVVVASPEPPAHVPGLDAALLAAVRRVAAVRSCWAPSLAPGGDVLAYVTDRSGLPRLEVVALERGSGDAAGDVVACGEPRQVSGPDQEVVTASWAPDGSSLLYVVAPGGLVRTEVHAVRPDGGGRRRVAGGGATETAVLGAWTPDGGHLLSVADGTGPDATLHALGPDAAAPGTGEEPGGARRLAPAGYQVVTSVDAATGLAVVRRGPRGHRSLWLVPADRGGTGRRLLAAAVPPEEDRGEDGRVEHDGRGDVAVLARTDALPGTAGRVALVRVPLVDGVPGEPRVLLARSDADLEAAAPLPGGALLCRWNVRGRTETEVRRDVLVRDPGLGPAGRLGGPGAPVPVAGEHVALPPGAEVVLSWSVAPDGRGAVVEAGGPRLPRSLWWVRLPHAPAAAAPSAGPPGATPTTGGPRPASCARLLGCTPPADLPGSLVVPALERFSAADGLPLEAWVYRPPGTTGPVPTVVFLHGGPEGQERPLLQRSAQALAAAGVAVVAPNVRGSDGYGARFRQLDDGAARWASMEDVTATVDHALRSGLAAPGRLGVHGWSYGGYLALAALVRWPDLFAAGSSLSGMSDLTTFYAGTETWMAAASTPEYGDPVRDAALLRRLSPMTGIGRVRVPVLLTHGELDTNVPLQESVQAHAALRAQGTPAELVLLPGEAHAIVGAPAVRTVAERLTSFFVRTLRPGDGPAAVGVAAVGGAA